MYSNFVLYPKIVVLFTNHLTGEEKLDARRMQFHETVIPKEESYYDYYPILDDENGKYVVLNSRNVQRFVFTDLKVKRSLYALSCYNLKLFTNTGVNNYFSIYQTNA